MVITCCLKPSAVAGTSCVIGPKKAGVLGFLGCFIETLCAAFLFPAEEGHVFFFEIKTNN